MTPMKLRNVVLFAGTLAVAACLNACAGQPNAGCPVATSNPAVSLPPFWVKYTPVTSTGACGQLPGEGIGFQKYNVPGSKDTQLAYRIEGLGLPYEEERRDPEDPEGKNLNGFSKLAPLPDAQNYCEASEFTPAAQNFEAIAPEPLKDGGMTPAVPALSRKYEFQNLKFLATVNAPGTILVGQLKLTENSCTATFSALGLWPQIACNPTQNGPKGYNLACDPYAKPDAGHNLGSGINPTFSPEDKPLTCGPAGFCELQLTVDEVAKL